MTIYESGSGSLGLVGTEEFHPLVAVLFELHIREGLLRHELNVPRGGIFCA